MKLYRFYYWFGSCTTEMYVRAANKTEAEEIFRKKTNGKQIITIEEVSE